MDQDRNEAGCSSVPLDPPVGGLGYLLREKLRVLPNRIGTTTELVIHLKTSRVAVVAAGRAMERRGLVVSFRHGTDRWAPLRWAYREAPNAGVTGAEPQAERPR